MGNGLRTSNFGVLLLWNSAMNYGHNVSEIPELYDLTPAQEKFLEELPESGAALAKEALDSTKEILTKLDGNYKQYFLTDRPYSERKKLAFELYLLQTKLGMIESFLRRLR